MNFFFFFCQDIIISATLAVGHFVGGILESYYGNEWADDDDDDDYDDADKIKNSMIASAVSHNLQSF